MDDRQWADTADALALQDTPGLLFTVPFAAGPAAETPFRGETGTAAVTREPRDGGLLKSDAVVLLVEDNIIFSLDAEDMLRRLGVAAVVTRNEVRAALDVLDSQPIDLAVLDINLGAETSLPVAERLRAAGIPFAFASDHDDPAIVPPQFGDVPVLAKPYTMEGLGGILIR